MAWGEGRNAPVGRGNVAVVLGPLAIVLAWLGGTLLLPTYLGRHPEQAELWGALPVATTAAAMLLTFVSHRAGASVVTDGPLPSISMARWVHQVRDAAYVVTLGAGGLAISMFTHWGGGAASRVAGVKSAALVSLALVVGMALVVWFAVILPPAWLAAHRRLKAPTLVDGTVRLGGGVRARVVYRSTWVLGHPITAQVDGVTIARIRPGQALGIEVGQERTRIDFIDRHPYLGDSRLGSFTMEPRRGEVSDVIFSARKRPTYKVVRHAPLHPFVVMDPPFVSPWVGLVPFQKVKRAGS